MHQIRFGEIEDSKDADIEIMNDDELNMMDTDEFNSSIDDIKITVYPKWYARARGYNGGSRTTIWWENKERNKVLENVPMRRIDSYFQPVSKYPQDSGAEIEIVPSQACMSKETARSDHMQLCFTKIDNILTSSNSSFPG